jgi:hypothetical protein
MAKRRTIGENPLDAITPDPAAGRREEKFAEPKAQAPASVSSAKAKRSAQPTPKTSKLEKGAATPAESTRSQSPSQKDLLIRIQSVEEQSAWIKWLAYGAIALALVL